MKIPPPPFFFNLESLTSLRFCFLLWLLAEFSSRRSVEALRERTSYTLVQFCSQPCPGAVWSVWVFHPEPLLLSWGTGLCCWSVCHKWGLRQSFLFQLVTVRIPPGILARNRQACTLLVEVRQTCFLPPWWLEMLPTIALILQLRLDALFLARHCESSQTFLVLGVLECQGICVRVADNQGNGFSTSLHTWVPDGLWRRRDPLTSHAYSHPIHIVSHTAAMTSPACASWAAPAKPPFLAVPGGPRSLFAEDRSWIRPFLFLRLLLIWPQLCFPLSAGAPHCVHRTRAHGGALVRVDFMLLLIISFRYSIGELKPLVCYSLKP